MTSCVWSVGLRLTTLIFVTSRPVGKLPNGVVTVKFCPPSVEMENAVTPFVRTDPSYTVSVAPRLTSAREVDMPPGKLSCCAQVWPPSDVRHTPAKSDAT